MKYLKLYESKEVINALLSLNRIRKFKQSNERHLLKNYIENVCDHFKIDNYEIDDDFLVNVNSDVYIYNEDLNFIPLEFKNVSGDFKCYSNKLESLAGSPTNVGGDFNCSVNNITSLEGGPKYVGGNFYCNNNLLTSLEGGPKYVGGGFCCNNNNLTSLKGIPDRINGSLNIESNHIKNFEDIPKIGGSLHLQKNPVFNIWELFMDIEKIELFNYYDIIQGDTIIGSRLYEFLKDIGKFNFSGYKIV